MYIHVTTCYSVYTEPVDSDDDRTPSKDQDKPLEPQLKRLGTGDTEIVDDPKKDEMPHSKGSRKKKKKQKCTKKGEVSKPKDRSKSKDKSLTPKIGGWSDEEKGASSYVRHSIEQFLIYFLSCPFIQVLPQDKQRRLGVGKLSCQPSRNTAHLMLKLIARDIQ